MSRILVTGFAPFLGDEINPTQKMVEALGLDPSMGARVQTAILPVSFQRSADLLRRKVRADHRAVLMFGQARGRAKFSLERIALNWTETTSPDEDGVTPVAGPIIEGAPSMVANPLPLHELRAFLAARGLPAEISVSAGGYVCNSLLFHATQLCAVPVLFVHVPVLPEQVKDGEPWMEFADMMKGARAIVDWLHAQVS